MSKLSEAWRRAKGAMQVGLHGRRYTDSRRGLIYAVDVLFTAREPEAARFEWCEENITGKFSTISMGRHPTLVAYRLKYIFSNPDDAFAFKMRWG
jgi:hypothetical protein